jgi:hypothetical protein
VDRSIEQGRSALQSVAQIPEPVQVELHASPALPCGGLFGSEARTQTPSLL